MHSKLRIFTLFIYCSMAVLVAFAPFILKHMHCTVDPFDSMRVKKTDWSGVVELWNTCYVKVGRGSQAYWLDKQMILPYEAQHSGLFVNLVSVEPSRAAYELELARASDALPDIVSLPQTGYGVYANELFEPIVPITKGIPFVEGLNQDEASIAWAVGGYAWMLNTELCSKYDVNAKSVEEILTYAQQADGPVACLFPSHYEDSVFQSLPNGATVSSDAFIDEDSFYKNFLKQPQALSAVVPLRTYFIAQALQKEGKITGFESALAPDYFCNRQVCRLGVLKQENAEKRAICLELLAQAMSLEVQGRLSEIGMFSVRNDTINYEEGFLAQLEEQRSKSGN